MKNFNRRLDKLERTISTSPGPFPLADLSDTELRDCGYYVTAELAAIYGNMEVECLPELDPERYHRGRALSESHKQPIDPRQQSETKPIFKFIERQNILSGSISSDVPSSWREFAGKVDEA